MTSSQQMEGEPSGCSWTGSRSVLELAILFHGVHSCITSKDSSLAVGISLSSCQQVDWATISLSLRVCKLGKQSRSSLSVSPERESFPVFKSSCLMLGQRVGDGDAEQTKASTKEAAMFLPLSCSICASSTWSNSRGTNELSFVQSSCSPGCVLLNAVSSPS